MSNRLAVLADMLNRERELDPKFHQEHVSSHKSKTKHHRSIIATKVFTNLLNFSIWQRRKQIIITLATINKALCFNASSNSQCYLMREVLSLSHLGGENWGWERRRLPLDLPSNVTLSVKCSFHKRATPPWHSLLHHYLALFFSLPCIANLTHPTFTYFAILPLLLISLMGKGLCFVHYYIPSTESTRHVLGA